MAVRNASFLKRHLIQRSQSFAHSIQSVPTYVRNSNNIKHVRIVKLYVPTVLVFLCVFNCIT